MRSPGLCSALVLVTACASAPRIAPEAITQGWPCPEGAQWLRQLLEDGRERQACLDASGRRHGFAVELREGLVARRGSYLRDAVDGVEELFWADGRLRSLERRDAATADGELSTYDYATGELVTQLRMVRGAVVEVRFLHPGGRVAWLSTESTRDEQVMCDRSGRCDAPGGAPRPGEPGGLPRDVIAAVLRGTAPVVRDCFERGQPRAGRLSVSMVIGPEGAVENAQIAQEPSAPAPSLQQCVLEAVQRFRFPAPVGGGSVSVSFPFSVEPSS
jgi:TonB family protein